MFQFPVTNDARESSGLFPLTTHQAATPTSSPAEGHEERQEEVAGML